MEAAWETLKLPGVRPWSSSTPSASRIRAAAWQWAKHRGDAPALAARACCVPAEFALVRQLADDILFYVLEVCKWGALSLAAAEICDGVYGIGVGDGALDILHATALQHQFVVIPTAICSPGRLAERHPTAPANSGITIYRTGEDDELLRYLLAAKRIRASCADLLYIARELKAPPQGFHE